MARILALFRMLFLFIFLLVPPLLIAGVAGSVTALVAVLAVMVPALVAVLFLSERIIARHLQATVPVSPGLGTSLKLAIDREPCPGLRMIPDPASYFLITRRPGGAGAIFLSQGLLSRLDEEHVRGLFRTCADTLRRSDLPGRTFAVALACLLLPLLPSGWLAAVFHKTPASARNSTRLGVPGFLVFLTVFSYLWMLLRISAAHKPLPAPRLLDDAAQDIQYVRPVDPLFEGLLLVSTGAER